MNEIPLHDTGEINVSENFLKLVSSQMWFLFCGYKRTSQEYLLEMRVSARVTSLVGLEDSGLSIASKQQGEHAAGATHMMLGIAGL